MLTKTCLRKDYTPLTDFEKFGNREKTFTLGNIGKRTENKYYA